MDCKNLCAVFFVVLGLGGCAASKLDNTVALPHDVWKDAAFAYKPALVTETPETVFALDPDVVRSMGLKELAAHSTKKRLNLLLARFYGANGIRLSYASGHTTGASETWRSKRGDCLSLTILSFASARYLDLEAHMQDVQVPAFLDRRNGVDYINGHVNVMLSHVDDVTIEGRSYGSGNLIIDFEPQVGTRSYGQWLTESDIMARFYNNRATEYLVQKDDARAYAYYRAAIETAPAFAAAYGNLAQLYVKYGLLPGAEQLLRHAIALGGPTYAPLRTMQTLMLAQGRKVEAQYYAELLAKRQDEDPYHWMGLGLSALGEGHNSEAIRALERAASLTTGFEELHFYLGVAYWRNGQPDAARKQLAAMNAIDNKAPGVAMLSKKLQGTAPAVY
jgi:tetratricopeptide (TPR) repeat protein